MKTFRYNGIFTKAAAKPYASKEAVTSALTDAVSSGHTFLATDLRKIKQNAITQEVINELSHQLSSIGFNMDIYEANVKLSEAA